MNQANYADHHETRVNRRVVLASRPHGTPIPANFRLESVTTPAPSDGQVLLRTRYLSLDPYMRNVMNEVGPVYAPSITPGEVMIGGTISRVVESRHSGFQVGDLVLANAGWQDYATSNGDDLMPLSAMSHPSRTLGVLGMPAFTAYVGMLDIGRPQPGETMVVAAASGAVGSAAGQIAKLNGARVVGIAGGPEKCGYTVDELGFDLCLDRHEPDLPERLAEACPKGIDIYFENVGGTVLDAVVPLLNIHARVPVIGLIAHYNDSSDLLAGPDRLPGLMASILQKRIYMQGVIILDHFATRFDAFQRDMNEWIVAGRVKFREEIVDGLENAPDAFVGMLRGDNFGKLVVQVSADENTTRTW